MNLMEELRTLDTSDPGRWPLPIRLGAIGIWFIVLTFALSYFFVWSDKRPELDAKEAEEQQLRSEFQTKHAKAVNLDVYKTQLKDIERSFGALLRQLPGKSEMEALLTDINQAGLGRGLQFELFKPAATESASDFYAELPINIRVTGGYHDIGAFASDVAKLSRIVLLNDVNITPGKDGGLAMDAVAKTYRYLDEDEIAKQRKSAKGAAKK